MTTIAQNGSAIGFSPVIAILRKEQHAEVRSLRSTFTAQAGSPLGGASLVAARLAGVPDATPPRARVYPHLSIVYGTVDAVYRVGGSEQASVCAAVAGSGGYGKWLDNTSDPDARIDC